MRLLKNLCWSLFGMLLAMALAVVLVMSSPSLLQHYGKAFFVINTEASIGRTKFRVLLADELPQQIPELTEHGLLGVKNWAKSRNIDYHEQQSWLYSSLDLWHYPGNCQATLIKQHRWRHFYIYSQRQICEQEPES